MTVGTQVQKAIVSVESVSASMKTFALETQDQAAKQMFEQLAQTFDGALDTLKQRQQYIVSQEPQYNFLKAEGRVFQLFLCFISIYQLKKVKYKLVNYPDESGRTYENRHSEHFICFVPSALLATVHKRFGNGSRHLRR